MPLRKTEAIVLKSFKQGETSKILTLYTRSLGKLKVIAKGARSAKSRFGGSLELANYIAIVFYEKEGRELQTLSQAEIITPFASDCSNLEKTTLMMAACELVDRLETGTAPSPLVFKLLLQTLTCIQKAPQKPLNCLRALQVRLLDPLGIRPDFRGCSNCNADAIGEVVFDIVHGNFVCEKCRQPNTPGMLLCAESWQAIRVLQNNSLANLNGVLSSQIAQQQVDQFLAAYLRYHLEGFRELNALRFYKKIQESH